MNDRQRKFCEAYAANPNATEAAKAAGYSAATAYSIGQRWSKNVETKNYIDELTAAARTVKVADLTETLEYLTAVMRNTDELTRERTKAAQLLATLLRDAPDDKDDDPHFEVCIIDASIPRDDDEAY